MTAVAAPAFMTLAQAAALLPGCALVGDGGIALKRVHSDSRSLLPGDLFVALAGERFDGHDFLPQAHAAGAVAALAVRGLTPDGMPGLQVADSLVALQALAAAWRASLSPQVIAVAGSNGKTTVTQMTGAILRASHGRAALSTDKSFNNHIGVPLTLLRLRATHRIAVMEVGTNHPGEIARLAAWVRPQVALVNNAQREHQEFLHGLEAVARENGAVIDALPPDGCAVFPADDGQTPVWQGLAGGRRVLRFGASGSTAEVRSVGTWQGDHWRVDLDTPWGSAEFPLHAPGAHNLRNAAAAAAAALAAGVSLGAVASGLIDFRPVAGRSRLVTLTRGDGSIYTLLDDSYNANPDSVRAAIDMLAAQAAPRWLVLGDMGEVGSEGPAFHAEVGAYARERGIAQLWAVGTASRGVADAFGAAGCRHFADVPALISALGEAPRCASALVKGSLFMGMARVVRALETAHAA
ncbi:MAG: UDP-N-acetylmuramoyl-tripeptide--D-alanyl-D-alanine ligase [Aquabacterium sp.]